jgi:hypothetical protein
MRSAVSLSRGIGVVVLYATGCLPILWVVGVLAFAVRAWSHLGYWPSPNHPDPQFLPFGLHNAILFYATYAVLWTLVVVPGFRHLLREKIDLVTLRKTKRIFATGWLAILILAFVPGINFVAWYLD